MGNTIHVCRLRNRKVIVELRAGVAPAIGRLQLPALIYLATEAKELISYTQANEIRCRLRAASRNYWIPRLLKWRGPAESHGDVCDAPLQHKPSLRLGPLEQVMEIASICLRWQRNASLVGLTCEIPRHGTTSRIIVIQINGCWLRYGRGCGTRTHGLLLPKQAVCY